MLVQSSYHVVVIVVVTLPPPLCFSVSVSLIILALFLLCFFFFFLFCNGFSWPWQTLTSLCNQGWPRISYSPAHTALVLRLLMSTILSVFCAGSSTWGFAYARQSKLCTNRAAAPVQVCLWTTSDELACWGLGTASHTGQNLLLKMWLPTVSVGTAGELVTDTEFETPHLPRWMVVWILTSSPVTVCTPKLKKPCWRL